MSGIGNATDEHAEGGFQRLYVPHSFLELLDLLLVTSLRLLELNPLLMLPLQSKRFLVLFARFLFLQHTHFVLQGQVPHLLLLLLLLLGQLLGQLLLLLILLLIFLPCLFLLPSLLLLGQLLLLLPCLFLELLLQQQLLLQQARMGTHGI